MASASSDNPEQAPEWISKRASGPSRSQRRREALDVLALAQTLMDAPEGMLPKLPLDDDLRALLIESRRVRQQIARKRQTQFLAKHLRREDDEALDALRAMFVQDREQHHRETARLHRLESLRDRLITEGDDAVEAVVASYPQVDRTHLRQLVRQAQREQERQSPVHAAREIFRMLRDCDAAQDATSNDGD